MKFTNTHEWIELETDNVARIGITTHAQKELGDIVYVELPVVEKQVKAGQEVAVLESTKAAADVYSPLTGTIVEVNAKLKEAPELVNHAPEGEGWIYKIRFSNASEWDLLMDNDAYEAMVDLIL